MGHEARVACGESSRRCGPGHPSEQLAGAARLDEFDQAAAAAEHEGDAAIEGSSDDRLADDAGTADDLGSDDIVEAAVGGVELVADVGEAAAAAQSAGERGGGRIAERGDQLPDLAAGGFAQELHSDALDRIVDRWREDDGTVALEAGAHARDVVADPAEVVELHALSGGNAMTGPRRMKLH